VVAWGGDGSALDEAIEGLYLAFEAYPLRLWTEPCTHCHTAEDERAVHRHPLRELRPEDLSGFAADSLMTWGEVVDLKHFLPRLFEILATQGFPYPDTESIVGALDRGAWSTWPDSEQAAVARYLMAWWRAHLTTYPALHRTDSLLSALAIATEDMGPYLDEWLAAEGLSPTLHFADFVEDNAVHSTVSEPLTNPWLRHRPEQERQVREWMLHVADAFLPRLEAAFLDAADDPTLEMLAHAIDVAAAAAR